MLDPEEWTLAIAVALVRRSDNYEQAEPLRLVGDGGQFVRVQARMINGVIPGELESALSPGDIENQARTVIDSIVDAADGLRADERRPRRGPESVAVVATWGSTGSRPIRAMTAIEVWSD